MFFTMLINLIACQKPKSQEVTYSIQVPAEFKSYWYTGESEITTFQLQQSRYGELRNGTAVLIYVTEDFVPDKQVKADHNNETNISVLKLNTTKEFLTGVYPYNIIQSTFFPLEGGKEQALKVSASVQEWCGHVFMQLNNRDQFDIQGYSYFESEGDTSISIPKVTLENELWNLLRINPQLLPQGKFNAIPSFEYLRLKHKSVKAYQAVATLKRNKSLYVYNLIYPELERELNIQFENTFPYIIHGWREQNGIEPATVAERITTKMLPYWGKNNNRDLKIRSELGLR